MSGDRLFPKWYVWSSLFFLVIAGQGHVGWKLCMAAAQGPRSGAAQYVTGMDALQQGNYKQAVAVLSQALEADQDNVDYVRARGVAETLAEDFPAARADLERAMKLDPNDREARLWLAAAYYMGGDAMKGSENFGMGDDISKPYAALVYLQMATEYATSKMSGGYFDRQTQQFVKTSQPERRLFPEAAAWYVRRHKPSGAGATKLVDSRVAGKLAAGDFAGARPDLTILLQNRPEDPLIQKRWTQCLLGLKDLSGARTQATYTLGMDPLWKDGYLLRAEAAAKLGDARRAHADVETATRLGATNLGLTKARLPGWLGSKAPEQAPAQFKGAVEAGAAWEALAPSALVLDRWFESHRTRYDEGWQDRLLLLAEAQRKDPKNPERAVLEGRFLLNTVKVPAVWNGPRAEPLELRRQSQADRERELTEALELADQALKLDPREVNAIATKAQVYYIEGKGGEASSLVENGLAIEGDNVPLLRLDAQLLENSAAALMSQATGLRTGHTSTRYENRADGVYRVETHYEPSAAQVAQAQGLEQQAQEDQRRAAAASSRAQAVIEQKIPLLLQQAERAAAKKEFKAAETACRQALRLWPDNPKAMVVYAEVLGRAGRPADQMIYALLAQPIKYTSAAEELKQAWSDIERTAFQTAEPALDRGESIDPTDARLLACRSVIAQGRHQESVAEHWRQGALALQEASARRAGTSFEPTATGPLEAADAGLALRLMQDSAVAQLKSDPPKALALEQAICALERRLPKDALADKLPSAMLPDPNHAAGVIPEAPTLASMFAGAHLHVAQILMEQNHPREAEPEFQRALGYLNAWPYTRPGRETLDQAAAWARLGLAECALGQQNLDQAMSWVDQAAGASGVPPEFGQQVERVRNEIYRRRQKALNAEFQNSIPQRTRPGPGSTVRIPQ